MKLADRTVEIHTRGLESSNQFTIAQTSKMFKILSDSLYSDKVMAVIRELSTNAYDAHIAAGNKNPFKVILPTQTNPSFTVRDYGTGLSQKDMEELYTTYGASNKNDSNDFVGCLGLGSKSPFAYTKSFSTTSYYNGTKYSYIAAMDENGVPSLNLFDISPTKEPNGLEISFAVKQMDFSEFCLKSKRIFHYFKMKPIIEGGIDSSLNDHSYSYTNIVIDGNRWKIGRVSNDNTKYPSPYNGPNSGVVAIMGNIAYPVDVTRIIGEDKDDKTNDSIQRWNRAFKKADVDNWKSLVREILNSGLYLEIQFDIGELEMDVSREGLQYTKNVIKVLRDRTQDIYLQLKEDMSTKIAECTNLVDAYITYYSLSDIAGGYTAGASWTDENNKVHELASGKDLEYKFNKNDQLYVINWRSAGYRSRRLVYLTDKIHHETLQNRGYHYWDRATKKNGKMVFFLCDVGGAETAKKIVTKYCNDNDCFAYLLVNSTDPKNTNTNDFAKLLEDIGGEKNILKVSDYRSLITRSPRKTSVSFGQISSDDVFMIANCPDANKKSTLSGKGINDSHLLTEIDEDTFELIEDQDEVVYIPILRYGSVDNQPSINLIHHIISHEAHPLHSFLKNQNILAIKQSSVTKIKNINLVDFNSWFKPKLKEKINKLCGDVSSYKHIIDFCSGQYNSEERSDVHSYYKPNPSDRLICSTVINFLGINYRDYISGKKLCDLVDQWMILYFFSNILQNNYDLKLCTKTEYFVVMAKILEKYGLNGIDPEKIRKQMMTLIKLQQEVGKLYGDEYASDLVSTSEQSKDFCDSLLKISELRKNLKQEVDKVPLLKYIVASGHGVNNNDPFRSITSNNPLKFINHGYYGAPTWYLSMDTDKIEELRLSLSSSIK